MTVWYIIGFGAPRWFFFARAMVNLVSHAWLARGNCTTGILRHCAAVAHAFPPVECWLRRTYLPSMHVTVVYFVAFTLEG